MFAPGAIECTASTSSVSSPHQPCGSCLLFSARLYVPGATTCENWLPENVGNPCRCEYVFASCRIVGDAYASMIATVWPEPSGAPVSPYAPRSCCHV